MKVVVSRSGGIAGIRTTWEVDVDAQPDAADWAELITALPWAEVSARAPEPDRFVYRIRCAPNEVVLAEPQVCGPWKELVDRVKASRRAESGPGPRPAGPRRSPDSPLGGFGADSQPPG
ncbi:hypothetical protein RCH16_000574 [Cryobacterium sp. MP_M5]|uniref:protealysin inhibitor emfourin n=1 Tax=unclassified Cryobacterium TaxID=2649013 RepID=UPI0018CAC883|nr:MULTISPECIES: protealysin inhibitor emfourin [unclassified Cryobacterium]MBG6057382.1 hypothetical protein [Cryobacterium sp. MP_M3]MEC5175581.1 hypothetical protein [Cryobacterium sp. MP_M5]